LAKDPILVVLFLRGGADGLNLIAPSGDTDYIAARPPFLRVVRKGDDAGHLLSHQVADVDFRFHSQAGELAELFEAKELAVIHAAGLTDGTRSHFDAEDRMERAANGTNAGGWLGRWLNGAGLEGELPALAVGTSAPESTRGSSDVAVAEQMEQLIIAADHDLSPLLRKRLRAGFGSHDLLGAPIERLITLSQTLETRLLNPETGELGPYRPSVDYPEENTLSEPLRTVAQAIKLDLGMRVATVDFGGWDTHMDQSGDFADQTATLSSALMAFWRDLGEAREHTCVVVMSEFGRRLRSNSSGGTDHGFGNAMMVLGGTVDGGKMLGEWPGLVNDALDDGADLAITTDYRHVLGEVMNKHMAAQDLNAIFPDFTHQPRGVFG